MAGRKMLVAGASGLIGREALQKFNALPGWSAIGISRRTPVALDTDIPCISLDLMDGDACRRFIADHSDVTHLVYAALYEKDDLVAGWRQRDHMETNLTMLRNLLDPLLETCGGFQHMSLLQGTKAYGAHIRPLVIPAKERWPRDDHENFYWWQEDYMRDAAAKHGFSFTIWRPQIVLGVALHAPMNFIAVMGVYAAIMRELGEPLRFPGGARYISEATDVRLLADAFQWATENEAARDETFNITNGDVAVWRNLFPAIARAFNMELGEPKPMRLAEEMPKHAALWQHIVQKYDLLPHSMADLVGGSWQYCDFGFAYGRDTPPPPAVVSTIKLRQAGFPACLDTEDTIGHWLGYMQDKRLLPR